MAYAILFLAIVVGVVWAFVVFPSFRIVVAILVAVGIGASFVVNEKAVQIPVHRGQSFRRIADSVPVIADSFR